MHEHANHNLILQTVIHCPEVVAQSSAHVIHERADLFALGFFRRRCLLITLPVKALALSVV